MSTLAKLFTKYNSNKTYHGYPSFYEKLFENQQNTYTHFLEIGIDNGASIFAWRDYFLNSIIYGIDISIPPCMSNQDRIKVAFANQASSEQLEQVIKEWNIPVFDCILDDGGHTVNQQRTSIETLWKYVKSDGYYIIEDLHTNIRELFSIHPHMNEQSIFIDELPTVHSRIMDTMVFKSDKFSFYNEIDEIFYFSKPGTMSLSCAIKKK